MLEFDTGKEPIVVNKFIPLSLALALCLSSHSPAEAKSNNWLIKSKSGDQIEVKDGWFGTGNKEVKSAKYGTVFENKKGVFSEQSAVNTPVGNVVKKKGLFGKEEKEVNVLGNSYSTKKGLFGSKTTEVKTMFGDSVKTKKGWFGRTTTEVDPGGLGTMLGSMMGLSVTQQ